jgi:hypothetical protein
MADLAVVKPDHLGDFVLSLPALRALARVPGGYDLYAAPGNRFLAQRLLPAHVRFHPLQLPHLVKGAPPVGAEQALSHLLATHRSVLYLRDDGALDVAAAAYPGVLQTLPAGLLVHETELQRSLVALWAGHYSRTAEFCAETHEWPDRMGHVGVSLSAGFTSNKLPSMFWHEVVRRLHTGHGAHVSLIAGPQERGEAQLLARLLGQHVDVLVGGPDLGAFHDAVRHCDAVVGADSGTLHLASLVAPVLGVFTSSPWWRYAPFGRHNRVIHARVPCSPCIQFSRQAYNGCLTRECAGLIRPQDVVAALFAQAGQPLVLGPAVSLVEGASHHMAQAA